MAQPQAAADDGTPAADFQVAAYATTSYRLYRVDAFEWLSTAEPNSIHAVVTDPPYGLVEYSDKELSKLKAGRGGVWRMPPQLGGHRRRPVPRFTVLDQTEKNDLRCFFADLASALAPVLVPGAHVMVATNPLVSHLVYQPFIDTGFEKRGEIIRTVSTLRGGDRPKNAHEEFSDVTVMPRSSWEPWGLFRKPIEGRVQDNLRKWGTGALRRRSAQEPFRDLIASGPTPARERAIAPHPSLKPQRLMRELVRAALPLGVGTILDPFMGAGSTIAAAAAHGLDSIGLEVNEGYYEIALRATPQLMHLVAE